MGWIYILENKINGKCYVGQTIRDVMVRIRQHLRSKYPIGNALRYYGIENFNIYSFECDEEDLDYFECGFIKQMNTLAKNGYNLDSGGSKGNKKAAEETRRKIGAASKGRQSWLGRKHTDKTKKLLSEQRKGKTYPFMFRKWTDEQKQNASKILKEYYKTHKHPMIGKKLKPETIEKMKAWKCTEQTKQKMRDNHADFTLEKHPKSRKVILIETGEVFDCIKLAAIKYELNYSSVKAALQNDRILYNKYTFKYYKDK